MEKPIAILIAALGGEGGGVLAEWLVALAAGAGHPAQSTSIPGVAQRTGATAYYIEIWPAPVAAPGARAPVLSLLPVPGCIDLVVASELLEAVRTAQNGMISADRTLLLTSTCRALTTAEKMPLGDGRFDSELLLEVARTHSRQLVAFDMDTAAREAGTVVSAVMFGAIAASGVLPFARERFEAVIRDSGRGVAASLDGFARGHDAARRTSGAPVADAAPGRGLTPPGRGLPQPELAPFPAATHDFLRLGYARLVDYQDREYAEQYLQRLAAVLAAERAADPQGARGFELTRETARFLALWMAFDDIVRVAHLKCRASRFARVRREVAAGERDVVRIVDYLRPGVPEFASLLPAPLARRLVAWDRRRRARGAAPLSFPLALSTDSVTGFLVLRALGGLAWLRPRGSRFKEEQAQIERWLGAIATAAHADWPLAYEIALCGRLIKGYGATNERGKANLAHILDHVAAGDATRSATERAAAVRDARTAALADDAGTALDDALVRHGAPPRPTRVQPIRWTRKPAAERAAPAEDRLPFRYRAGGRTKPKPRMP